MRILLEKALIITLSLVFVQAAHANDIWVTDLTDDLDYNNGTCTLREAINSINQDLSSIDACPSFPNANRILFAKTGSISLSVTFLPDIQNSVEIVGPGSHLLNIVGIIPLPVFTISGVNPNLDVVVSGLSISDAGSAIVIHDGVNTRRITVQDCEFFGHENSAIIHEGSQLIVRRSTLRNNVTFSQGGAIRGGTSDTFLGIYQSSIINNRSRSGGGLYYTGNVEIDNSTFSGNSSEYSGGGIAFSGDLSITNSTITENKVLLGAATAHGGGIYHFDEGSLYLYNSILSDNEDLNSDDVHDNFYRTGSGSVASGSAYNLIGVLNPPFGVGPFAYGEPNASNSWVGSNSSPLFALLNPLADNGGPTLTHSFQSQFSLPVDEGNCNEQILDQRGHERGEDQSLLADPCDMGSLERDSDRSLMGIQLKVFLDGALDSGGTMMRNDLQINDKLDEQSPYGGAPWNHTGLEEISIPFSSDIVDWVLVEISEGGPLDSGGLSRAESHAFLLDPSGILLRPNVESNPILVDPGYYWITVYHRNHLSVTSNGPLYFNWQSDVGHDFTADDTSAYTPGSGAQRYLASQDLYAMWGGDGDLNGSVTAFDFINVWLPNNGEPSGYVSAADFDMDGTISAFDFVEVWLPANGRSSQTP